MNWGTETVSSSFAANAGVVSHTETRGSQRTTGEANASIANAFGNVEGAATTQPGFLGIGERTVGSGVSIVGMNITQATTMREAIATYCSDITTYINGLQPTADATMAFQSQQVNEALANYMASVKTYCMNLVSQLLSFSDKLADVANQWQAAAANMATQINSTAGDNFASGVAYTEQVTINGNDTGGAATGTPSATTPLN